MSEGEGKLFGFSVWISMQDYRSPCVVVVIWVALVNTHTHTETVKQLLNSYIV